MDGRNPAPLGNHGKPLFVGICRGIILPGSIHSRCPPMGVLLAMHHRDSDIPKPTRKVSSEIQSHNKLRWDCRAYWMDKLPHQLGWMKPVCCFCFSRINHLTTHNSGFCPSTVCSVTGSLNLLAQSESTFEPFGLPNNNSCAPSTSKWDPIGFNPQHATAYESIWVLSCPKNPEKKKKNFTVG